MPLHYIRSDLMFLLGGDEAKMRVSRSTLVAVLAGLLVTGIITQAHTQAPISDLTAQADSRVQAAAAVLWRILSAHPAYAETGEWVGRVTNVTVGPNGASLVAIVTLRPRYGWGRIAVPASQLRQVRGRVIIPGTLNAIRAMPRVRGS